jgi:hypothetical protein
MLSLFLPVMQRRFAWPPPHRKILTTGLMVAATLGSMGGFSRLTRADEPAKSLGGLAGSGVEMVPADAAFLSATLRGREQYDRIMKSKAFAAIRKLPAVTRALDSLEEQRTMPGSPLSMADTFMQLPENEQALDLLEDMVATDTFVYGEPSCVSFLRLLQKLQLGQSRAGLADGAAGTSLEDSQKRLLVETLADNLDLVVVPDIVWGFRTTKLDAARSQLKRIEVLIKLMTQTNPELADSLQRRKVAGGEVVSFTVQGEQLPWNDIAQDLTASLGDSDDLDKILDRLRTLDLVIALGVIGDRVILSIGDSVDHLEKLALPGSGRKGLLSTKAFEPLFAHKDKPLTGISYMSGELAAAGGSSSSAEQLQQVLQQALEQGPPGGTLSPEAGADLKQMLGKAADDFGKRLPVPGPWMSFSFLAEQGYEGYAWDWSRNQRFDGSKRLGLLEHAGGAPLAVAVLRLKSDPAVFDDLVALADGGWRFSQKHLLPKADDDDREQAEEFAEHIVPLGPKFAEILRRKIIPSLQDGQIGLVLDAKTQTRRVQRELPESADPLPLLEPAIVLPLTDPQLFREGLSDLFSLSDELVDGVREMNPDSVPEGYEVPEPAKDKVEGGSVWSFPLTESGIDDQLRPAIGVGEQAAVFSLVPKQASRLLAASRLETGSQLSKFEEPLAGAAALDFAGLVDAIRPWVVYLTRYGCVQQRDGTVAADSELTADDETDEAKEALQHVNVVLDAVKSFRVAVAETSITDDAMVTHWRNVIRDLP